MRQLHNGEAKISFSLTLEEKVLADKLAQEHYVTLAALLRKLLHDEAVRLGLKSRSLTQFAA